MLAAARWETHEGVARLHLARRAPGVGAVYWASCYRIGDVLVDAGPAVGRAEVARFLDERPVVAAVATHEHEDHVGNARLLEDRGVPLYAPKAAVDRLRRIADGRTRRLPMYRAVAWGHHEGATAARVAAGRVHAGSRTFEVVATPGHSEEHAALLDEATGVVFTGDAVLGKLKMARVVEDIPRQVDSIRALIERDPRVVYPAHGPVLERPREDLGEIVRYHDDLARRAHALAGKGWGAPRIARELLGREEVMTWFSAGAFSKANLVRSLLARSL